MSANRTSDLRIVAVGRAETDADADTDAHLAAAFQRERRAQLRNQLASEIGYVRRRADLFQHQHELIAAEARESVDLADAILHPLGGQPQQLVSGLMAPQVVDSLEAVEVEEQHGTEPRRAACVRWCDAIATTAGRRFASPVSAS